VRGAWRWVVLIVAMCSVGIAALREQRSSSDSSASTSTNLEVAATTVEPLAPEVPIPDWCNQLLTIDETTSLDDVARLYLEAGMAAGGVVERDLTAAAIVLSGNEDVINLTDVTSTTVDGNDFDAEGRFVDDDAVLRASQQIDEICKRVSIQASPAATVPQ
jgi:hypothetical protein